MGVTYWSREVGPYVWHEYDDARVTADLRAIKSAGHTLVRTHLLWDAFMPTAARVEPARLRDLERFLAAADAVGLRVIPVMFVQTLGRCVMLPPYAIDAAARRSAVRAVTDAVAQPGAPRYVYADPMMLDVCVRWIDEMLAAFAGHPAILMWDIGHDPAGGVRPRRIEDLRRWTALMSARLREHGQRCMLSLSADDVVIPRAVRPGLLGPEVDVLGFEISTGALERVGDVLDPAGVTFLAQLCESIAGDTQLMAHVAASQLVDAEGSGSEMDDQRDVDTRTRRFAAGAVDALVDCGCSGVVAAMWSAPGPRAAAVPPFDRAEGLRASAVLNASGAETPFGGVWLEQARRERERADPAPWPAHLDADDYYANLPESLDELHAAWQRGSSEHPAMLR